MFFLFVCDEELGFVKVVAGVGARCVLFFIFLKRDPQKWQATGIYATHTYLASAKECLISEILLNLSWRVCFPARILMHCPGSPDP